MAELVPVFKPSEIDFVKVVFWHIIVVQVPGEPWELAILVLFSVWRIDEELSELKAWVAHLQQLWHEVGQQDLAVLVSLLADNVANQPINGDSKGFLVECDFEASSDRVQAKHVSRNLIFIWQKGVLLEESVYVFLL